MALPNKPRQQLIKTALWLVIFATMAQPALAQTLGSIDLAVHYVSGTPNVGQFTYDVSVFFSVLDASGNPIKDITADGLTLTEDGQQVTIESLGSASNEPLYVALAIDTSGSMSGSRLSAAKKAAISFVSSLNDADQVAVLSYNNTTTIHKDFTTDHNAAIQAINQISTAPWTGSCLYDATYKAVQLTEPLPAGRRVVIMLTDGGDLKDSGGVCSTYTADDVIELASGGTSRSSIYMVGLTSDVAATTTAGKALTRISDFTGGRFQYTSDAAQLEALYLRLSDQLHSQLMAQYTSTAEPGEHSVALKVTYFNSLDQDSRDFVLPPHPYNLAFSSPVEGEELNGMVTLSILISGQGEPIQQVIFYAGENDIGSDTTAPYELEWDAGTVDAGEVILKAVAYAENEEELTSTSITVKIMTPVDVAATATPDGTQDDEEGGLSPLLLGGLIGGVVLIMAIVIVVSIANKRRKEADAEREREWQEKVVNPPDLPPIGGDDRTLDAFEPSQDALGVLVILQSDDAAMQNERYEITKPVTKLGRKSDNDIIFARDSSVSRHHAIIEEQGGQLILSEVIGLDEGKSKPPTYGTFLNDNQLAGATALQDGDEIRLGRRVRLRFEGISRPAYGDDVTMDELELGDDATMDELGRSDDTTRDDYSSEKSEDDESTQDLGIRR